MLKRHRGVTLILVIFLSVVIRIAYINYAGNIITIEPDSRGYYSTKDFFTDDFIHNYFNLNRLPGYMMFTNIVISLTGSRYPAYLSPEFLHGAYPIIWIQTIIAVIGLIILYDLLLSAGVSSTLSLLFTGFTGINIYQFIWEHAFLNYALFITFVTIILRLFISLLKKPSVPTGVLFTLASMIALLLRPAGLFLPFILLPFVWLRHKTKKIFLLMLTLLCMYSVIPISHLVMNKYLYNFSGLSFNTDFAIFGRILRYNIPVDPARNVRPYYDEVVSYRARGENTSIPWYFFVYYNNEVYDHLGELQTFDRLVIQKYAIAFGKTVIADIPRTFSETDVADVLYQAQSPGIAKSFFDTLALFYSSLQKMTGMFLFLFPFSVWFYIKRQSVLSTFLLAVGILEIYQIVSTLLYGGSWDVAGHMITTQTYLFFFCFWWVGYLIHWVKKRL